MCVCVCVYLLSEPEPQPPAGPSLVLILLCAFIPVVVLLLVLFVRVRRMRRSKNLRDAARECGTCFLNDTGKKSTFYHSIPLSTSGQYFCRLNQLQSDSWTGFSSICLFVLLICQYDLEKEKKRYIYIFFFWSCNCLWMKVGRCQGQKGSWTATTKTMAKAKDWKVEHFSKTVSLQTFAFFRALRTIWQSIGKNHCNLPACVGQCDWKSRCGGYQHALCFLCCCCCRIHIRGWIQRGGRRS